MVKDFKSTKNITGKNAFVVLKEGLRFLSEKATAALKVNIVATPVFSIATA